MAANSPYTGRLHGVRIMLRIAIGGLIGAIVVIASVPLLVLRDLNSGGTGWGLCADGLERCTTSYFSGFELIIWLAVALLIVLVLLRAATRTLRFVEHRYDRSRAADSIVTDPSSSASGRVGPTRPASRPSEVTPPS